MTPWTFRPARDHGLTPAQRLRSPGREPGLTSLLLATAWQTLTRTYLRTAHRLTITGQNNLPQPPFIMIANHASHLDALTLAAALPRHLAPKTFALAAGDTFFTTTARAAFAAYAINALPVWRSKTSAQNLKDLRAKLETDHAVLLLFPEGTRTRTGAMAPFKPGIGALIAGTPIPVIPCHIQGAHQAWPPTNRLPRPHPIHLTIGTPLHFATTPPTRPNLTHISNCCEQAVRALAPLATNPPP